MKHKVTCMDCGKTERIEVEKGKPIKSGWGFFGRINVNACQTDKFHFRINRKSDGSLDFDNPEKITNPCYDQKIKPKMVELWECSECVKKTVPTRI